MKNDIQIAPLQLLVVAFDKPEFSGQITAELDKARHSNLIRVVDSLIVYKDAAGSVQLREKSDLSFEEIGAYGTVLGSLLGLGSGNEDIVRASSNATKEAFEERYQFGLDKEDVEDLVQELPNNSAAMFLLIEHLWAGPVRDSIRQTGGVLLSQDFLSPELLIGIGRQAYAAVA